MSVNYLAILVAGIAMMIVGSIWYGPLFGKTFIASMGWDKISKEEQDKMKKGMIGNYVLQFIFSLVTIWVLAVVLHYFRIVRTDLSGTVAGLHVALLAWVGFYLPVKCGEKLWTGKMDKMLWIDLGHFLVSLVVAGLILGMWK